MNHEIKVTNNFGLKMTSSVQQLEEGVMEYTYTFSPNEAQRKSTENPVIHMKWSFPYVDIGYLWHPLCGTNRQIHADWSWPIQSMTSISAPIACLFSEDQKNRYTYALSEIREIVASRFGIHEEDGTLICTIEIPMKDFIMENDYTLKLLEDRRDIPYYESIENVPQWWEKVCGIVPMQVPDEAQLPVYSSWYSYHQDLFAEEIEEECRLASAMGFKTIIVDDGWQTMDNNRGYAFCGDWEMAEGRFPDFAAHVKKVHEMGMKYMIWYSVPYVGKQAKVWEKFKDKLLCYIEYQKAGVLDPRYPEVREFLIQNYEHAVRDWDLDGLKLDFIDEIYFREGSPEYRKGMDYANVQEALEVMMREISRRLTALKPNILIEFRQRYIGPNMRSFGNMFRVGDCPNSGITNRVGVADLRLTSGNTAVHSDMLMWHKDEKPEIAALQIINSIFATVQISIKLGNVPEKQVEMVRYWVQFMTDYRDMLLRTPLIPYEPQTLYPILQTKKDDSTIIAVYVENKIIPLESSINHAVIMNGTKAQELFLRISNSRTYHLIEKDCYGHVLRDEVRWFEAGINIIPVTTAGQIYLEEC
ncbi:MAG: glycoside hydrolase family 36 protein [Massiliimalia sp.]